LAAANGLVDRGRCDPVELRQHPLLVVPTGFGVRCALAMRRRLAELLRQKLWDSGLMAPPEWAG
jgi:hypothetical protein